jgi:hypothetical protein
MPFSSIAADALSISEALTNSGVARMSLLEMCDIGSTRSSLSEQEAPGFREFAAALIVVDAGPDEDALCVDVDGGVRCLLEALPLPTGGLAVALPFLTQSWKMCHARNLHMPSG